MNKVKKYDKRNDAHWCGQFVYPILGILFILMNLDDVKKMIEDKNMVMFGIIFIVVGFMHHLLWKQGDTFRKALDTLVQASINETEEPNQEVDSISKDANTRL